MESGRLSTQGEAHDSFQIAWDLAKQEIAREKQTVLDLLLAPDSSYTPSQFRTTLGEMGFNPSQVRSTMWHMIDYVDVKIGPDWVLKASPKQTS